MFYVCRVYQSNVLQANCTDNTVSQCQVSGHTSNTLYLITSQFLGVVLHGFYQSIGKATPTSGLD